MSNNVRHVHLNLFKKIYDISPEIVFASLAFIQAHVRAWKMASLPVWIIGKQLRVASSSLSLMSHPRNTLALHVYCVPPSFPTSLLT